MMDRRPWFIDFAKREGRERLNAYFVAVIKSIRYCDHDDPDKQIDEIDNAVKAFDEAFYDESLPWSVTDMKKPLLQTEAPKELTHINCTTSSKIAPLVDKAWAEEVLGMRGVIDEKQIR